MNSKRIYWGILVFSITLIEIGFATNCEAEYKFTACDKNNTRSAIFYHSSESCSNPLNPIIDNLDCNLKCKTGEKLDINIEAKKSKCVKCDQNSYSTGGTIHYSAEYANWNKLPEAVSNYCAYIKKEQGLDFEWEVNSGCSKWEAGAGNSLLQTGMSDGEMNSFFELSFYVDIVESGKVEFEFKADTRGNLDGKFTFVLDIFEELQFSNRNLSHKWQNASFDLEPGFHELNWVYFKYNTQELKNFTAYIRNIKITGAKWNSLDCFSCSGNRVSNAQRTACVGCLANQYLSLSSYKCSNCPAGKISHLGSVGEESCMNKPVCSWSDIDVRLSKCEASEQTVSYSWNDPKYCDDSGSTAVHLPPNKTQKCNVCEAGMKLNNGACEVCDEGYYSPNPDSSTCTACKPGSYTPSNLNLTNLPIDLFENTKYANIYKTCISHLLADVCKLTKGWKVVNNSIITGSNFARNFTLELTLETYFLPLGKIVFEYEQERELDEDEWVQFYINGKMMELEEIVNSSREFMHEFEEPQFVVFMWKYHKGMGEIKGNAFKLFNIFISQSTFGISTVCEACPEGFFSKELTNECTPCEAGSTSDDSGEDCINCSELKQFNTRSGDTCHDCKEFSRPGELGSFCDLYDIYVVDKEENTFNMFLFDPNNLNYQASKHQINEDGFFGPFRGGPSNNSQFFLSVFRPLSFKTTLFEYEQDIFDEDRERPGFIFGLIDMEHLKYEDIDSRHTGKKVNAENFKFRKNLGSQFESLDFLMDDESGKQSALLRFIKGDMCNPMMKTRFETEITLKCEHSPSLQQRVPQFISNEQCKYVFEWKTDAICKECKIDNAYQIETNCEKGKHKIINEETEECRILGSPMGKVKALYVEDGEAGEELLLDFDERWKLLASNLRADLSLELHDTLYFRSYSVKCSDVEVSKTAAILVIVLCCIFILLAGGAALCARRYKNKYQLLIEKDDDQLPSSSEQEMPEDKA